MSAVATGPSSQPLESSSSIKVVSHSMLFYWWPVWACGLVLGVLSLVDGYRMAIVPEGTRLGATPVESRGEEVPASADGRGGAPLSIRVARNPGAGVLFCCVVLAVLFSTNIPMRGLWSVIALLTMVIVALVLAGLNLWGPILEGLGHLHIYLSAAGYLFLSSVLFVVWVVTVFLYDQKRYILFTPGQLVVHREVGDMQQVYDTTNVIVEKQRSDFFRHVLLGFMSGDLVVQVAGQPGRQFELPNVLFAAWKVQQVADLMKTRPVVQAGV